MTTSYFTDLAGQICFHLSKAEQTIRAAVCWFSRVDIFKVLQGKLAEGVTVELLLEYDSQNIKENGLDFQHFIGIGGVLLAHCDPGLMHHKFAIVDDKLLLTGSFNWTYNSNAENLLVTDESCVVEGFQREFERQRNTAKRVFTIKNEEVKPFSAFPIFGDTNNKKVELRKKVAGGCSIWIVRTDKMKLDESRLIHEYLLPFDPLLLLTDFWKTARLFDKDLFESTWKNLSSALPFLQSRDLRLFACRMKTGDIVLLAGKKKQLRAVGIIQSEPKRFESNMYSSARDVLWLKILPVSAPIYLNKKGFLPAVGQFRGSGFRLLQEIFDGAELI